ncbi:MAG: AAA domain-containing protein [Acetobacter sp.]|nr:AAA domain-containing protein [Bacteroides sp.]MCM1341631.1 AAA domain-containing protein [Acetobacter sp.]MCM1434048.1 AAA domain-containing protein [Clostridiales bacterium]
MNTKNNLIFVRRNGVFEDKTKDIKFCEYSDYDGKCTIIFNNNKRYTYNSYNVKWYRNPTIVAPSTVRLFSKGVLLFDIVYIAVFNNEYWHIIFNTYEKTYHCSELRIEQSCLTNGNAKPVFNYLKLIADEISVKTEDDNKILTNQYNSMEKFISDNTVAYNYLLAQKANQFNDNGLVIFPFGSNSSQTTAVNNALTNQVSIIEGPPGTGKTQTILNIIANLIIRGKTVEVVSNNNSATENVYEKLCKYGYDFLVAPLGRKENKVKFIENQKESLPDIRDWKLEENQISKIREKIKQSSEKLNDIFEKQNELAKDKQEASAVKTEQVYFNEQCEDSNIPKINCKSYIKSNHLLKLWTRLDFQNNKIKQIINNIIFIFCFGLKNRHYINQNLDILISIVKQNYYAVRLRELNDEINRIEKELKATDSKTLLDNYVNLSTQYFKNYLYKKYVDKTERTIFKMDDLWKNPEEFIKEYPVVLSTTYSARSNLGSSSNRYIYDYVIMDEASQVDVATGLVALSVAKNAVIVGDRKQLPNVINETDRMKTNHIFSLFKIRAEYNFTKNSFLSSVFNIIPDVPNTLLREHYRCHPKIIEFCNQKFYDNQLIVMTKDSDETDTLKVYKTAQGNHARKHINQRQIDVITQEILPDTNINYSDIGIIAPYRDQVTEITNAIYNDDMLIDTVHKFQGREKDYIIMSTVDDKVNEFSDNPNLLNVAVSRAIKNFTIIVGQDDNQNTNIGDLVSYIEYNNFDIIESEIYSIFDYLYSQYQIERSALLSKSRRVSAYDSENLMYSLICKLLKENNHSNLGVVVHLPLKEIFKNLDKLDDKELNFVANTDSHVDFMIYNKVNKQPVLAVEVDGYDYHKIGTKQYVRDIVKDSIFEKYNLPLERFKTNGSGEKEILIQKLNSVIVSN